MTVCEYCNCEIPEDEEPLICESCWDNEHYMCALCYDEGLEAQQGAIGNLLVVVDAEEAGLPEGLYEIISHPYWYSDYFSADFCTDALRYIGPIPDNVSVDTENCPVGHLCTQCSMKLKHSNREVKMDR